MKRQRGHFNPTPIFTIAMWILGIVALISAAISWITWPMFRRARGNVLRVLFWWLGVFIALLCLLAWASLAATRWWISP